MTKDEVFGVLLGKEMYDTVKAKINADDCYDVVRFIVLNELEIIDDDGNYITSVMDSIKDEIKEEVIAAICEDDDTSPECEAEKYDCKCGHCKENPEEPEEMTDEEQADFTNSIIEAFSDRKLNDEEKRAIKDALGILNKAFGHDK